MSKQFTVFYSWQSDTSVIENKNLINECLKKSIKENTKYIEVDREVVTISLCKE